MTILKSLFTVSLAALFCGEGSEAFSVSQNANCKKDDNPSRRHFLGAAAASVVAISGLPTEARSAVDYGGTIRFGGEEIMSQKDHGTSSQPVQRDLLYGVSNKLADKICNFNR